MGRALGPGVGSGRFRVGRLLLLVTSLLAVGAALGCSEGIEDTEERWVVVRDSMGDVVDGALVRVIQESGQSSWSARTAAGRCRVPVEETVPGAIVELTEEGAWPEFAILGGQSQSWPIRFTRRRIGSVCTKLLSRGSLGASVPFISLEGERGSGGTRRWIPGALHDGLATFRLPEGEFDAELSLRGAAPVSLRVRVEAESCTVPWVPGEAVTLNDGPVLEVALVSHANCSVPVEEEFEVRFWRADGAPWEQCQFVIARVGDVVSIPLSGRGSGSLSVRGRDWLGPRLQVLADQQRTSVSVCDWELGNLRIRARSGVLEEVCVADRPGGGSPKLVLDGYGRDDVTCRVAAGTYAVWQQGPDGRGAEIEIVHSGVGEVLVELP